MRLYRKMLLAGAASAVMAGALRAEIHDVLKSAEIDRMFARARRDFAVHKSRHYSVWFGIREGKARRFESHDGVDEVLMIRRGAGRIWLDRLARQYQVGPGDFVNISRNTPHRLDPEGGRVEYIAVRIGQLRDGQSRPGIRPAARRMADVLTRAEVDSTFARYDSNQPIHSAPNFTMNYVIYSGRSGPFEAHAGCVDIYFLKIGTAVAQLGGQIRNAKEESPGEPRGDGVTGARRYDIGPDDIVLIPRNTAHHMVPGPGKLGYVLLKVWAD